MENNYINSNKWKRSGKVSRKHPENWEVFYDHLSTLIKNLFIKNINYTNGYYSYDWKGISELLKDTQERGEYILEEMDRTKHLIDITDKEFTALQKERDIAVEALEEIAGQGYWGHGNTVNSLVKILDGNTKIAEKALAKLKDNQEGEK